MLKPDMSVKLTLQDKVDIVLEIALWLGYTVLMRADVSLERVKRGARFLRYYDSLTAVNGDPTFYELERKDQPVPLVGKRFAPYLEDGWFGSSLYEGGIHEALRVHGEQFTARWEAELKKVLEYRRDQYTDVELLLSPRWLYCEALVAVILEDAATDQRGANPICPICKERVKPGEEGIIQDDEGQTLHQACERQMLKER